MTVCRMCPCYRSETVCYWLAGADPRPPVMPIEPTLITSQDSAVRWNRFRAGLGLLVLVLVSGMVGYTLLGLTWLDAIYQTVITISTVGYHEIGPISTRYRVFTILLILFGTATALYTLGVLIDTMFEARLTGHFRRRRMQKRIDRLKGHTILCGFGQVGEAIYEELVKSGRQVVVVDKVAPDSGHFPPELLIVSGDATDDEVLTRAGVDRATGMVLALDSDVDNLYVTLSARSVNPNIFILARATQKDTVQKLEQAGADRVVNPHQIGGAHMAALISQPEAMDFLGEFLRDGDLMVSHCRVSPDSRLVGRTIGEIHIRNRTGCSILAIRHHDTFLTNPDLDTVLGAGDLLFALGTEGNLQQLRVLNETG
ncbi:MAG: potassium channel protein [Acidimicrobiia bacterium]|nr:potassium channel protein [Acidimicrobiia bacterium]MYF25849.1 potassium channel protein [Acidimicrobiia bacterium]